MNIIESRHPDVVYAPTPSEICAYQPDGQQHELGDEAICLTYSEPNPPYPRRTWESYVCPECYVAMLTAAMKEALRVAPSTVAECMPWYDAVAAERCDAGCGAFRCKCDERWC